MECDDMYNREMEKHVWRGFDWNMKWSVSSCCGLGSGAVGWAFDGSIIIHGTVDVKPWEKKENRISFFNADISFSIIYLLIPFHVVIYQKVR